MSTDGSTFGTDLDRTVVRSVSKALLTVASLLFLLSLVSMLPGIERLIPATPVTIVAVVSALVTVAIVVLLVSVAPKAAALTRMALHDRSVGTDAPVEQSRTEPVVENVAGIVHWLVILAALLVGYRGLAGAVTPLLGEHVWAYDAAFLMVALLPVVFVAARLSASIDPASDLLADRVAGPESDREAGGADDAAPEK